MKKWISYCLICFIAVLLVSCSAAPVKQSPEDKNPPTSSKDSAKVPKSKQEKQEKQEKKESSENKDQKKPDKSAPEPSKAGGLSLDDVPMGFGFADEKGGRLLVSYYKDEDDEYAVGPEEYTLAIGPYGELVNIKYVGWQEESEESNYREVSDNFDNLAGYVYRTSGGRLRANRTYVVTTEGPFIDSLIKLNPPHPDPDDPYLNTEALMMGLKTEDYIATLKKRKVQWAELLSVTGEGGQIGLTLFKRKGDNMLFSIVYLDGPEALFWDCEAEYDEYSTWRVDMGDEPGDFRPLFLARLGGRLVLLLTWGAPEGEGIVMLCEDEGKFTEREDGYYYSRYWSPM